MCTACVRSAMLHASETWPLTSQTSNICSGITGQWSDRSAMSSRKTLSPPGSNELLAQLGTKDLDLILKERRLCWYGHVEHSNGAVKTAFDILVDGKRWPGKPKMTCKQLTEKDCRQWKLSAMNPHDRHTWRSGMRSTMCAASQLPWKGLLMWMLPCICTLIKNLMMMDDDVYIYTSVWIQLGCLA